MVFIKRLQYVFNTFFQIWLLMPLGTERQPQTHAYAHTIHTHTHAHTHTHTDMYTRSRNKAYNYLKFTIVKMVPLFNMFASQTG